MEQIIEFIENIDFDAIITWVTDLIAQIDFQSILDQIMKLLVGFIA